MKNEKAKKYKNIAISIQVSSIVLIVISTIGYFIMLNGFSYVDNEVIFNLEIGVVYLLSLISLVVNIMLTLLLKYKSSIITNLSRILSLSLLILFFLCYLPIKYKLQYLFLSLWVINSVMSILISIKHVFYINNHADKLFDEFLSRKVVTLEQYDKYVSIDFKKRKSLNFLILLSMALSKIDFLIYIMMALVLIYELYCIFYYSKLIDKRPNVSCCAAITIYGLLLILTILTQIGIVNAENTNYKDAALFIFMISIPSGNYYSFIRQEIWKFETRDKIIKSEVQGNL